MKTPARPMNKYREVQCLRVTVQHLALPYHGAETLAVLPTTASAASEQISTVTEANVFVLVLSKYSVNANGLVLLK